MLIKNSADNNVQVQFGNPEFSEINIYELFRPYCIRTI